MKGILVWCILDTDEISFQFFSERRGDTHTHPTPPRPAKPTLDDPDLDDPDYLCLDDPRIKFGLLCFWTYHNKRMKFVIKTTLD